MRRASSKAASTSLAPALRSAQELLCFCAPTGTSTLLAAVAWRILLRYLLITTRDSMGCSWIHCWEGCVFEFSGFEVLPVGMPVVLFFADAPRSRSRASCSAALKDQASILDPRLSPVDTALPTPYPHCCRYGG